MPEIRQNRKRARLIAARMRATGENYTVAARAVDAGKPLPTTPGTPQDGERRPGVPLYYPDGPEAA